MTTIERNLLLVSLLCTPALGLAGDWNQWRGPQRTGAMVENRSYLDRLYLRLKNGLVCYDLNAVD